MRAGDVDDFFIRRVFAIGRHLNGHRAFADNWQLKLANLVAFGQIGVKVIFARKHTSGRDFGINRQAEFNRAFYCLAVQHWQHAWQGDTHLTGLGVGRSAILRGRAAENFSIRFQLRVGF